jgi:ATP-dependent DNA helicase Q1
VTPERVAKSKTLISKLQKAYAGGRLRRIVVDEVHCLAVDGQVRACWAGGRCGALRADFQCNVFQLNPPRLQDFRPDYLKLRTLRAVFPETPILGCTGATML